METHAKIFAMAVKYQVNGLRILTSEKFADAFPFDPYQGPSQEELLRSDTGGESVLQEV